MEYLKVAGKATAKKGFRLFRAQNHKNESNNVLDATAKVNGSGGGVVSCTEEEGMVRMKIVVKKGELKQLLEAMRSGANNNSYRSSSAPSLSLEERLILLSQNHLARANNAKKENSRNCWSPALQSIPEEI
ncbi:VWFA domain-containing protein [Quillaja saponaria]|uniref:VWFA domain-containing protein n=1 Tax=Quillaja saponaria TaxID=32244 RepID=A0AAD7PT06_QUISA|nr:VWFA domain-containing protein [Quillaja saponaria]